MEFAEVCVLGFSLMAAYSDELGCDATTLENSCKTALTNLLQEDPDDFEDLGFTLSCASKSKCVVS